jgi:hypothetical protein
LPLPNAGAAFARAVVRSIREKGRFFNLPRGAKMPEVGLEPTQGLRPTGF